MMSKALTRGRLLALVVCVAVAVGVPVIMTALTAILGPSPWWIDAPELAVIGVAFVAFAVLMFRTRLEP